MNPLPILCPGGAESQTGTAVKLRYPDFNIEKCGETIKAIADHLDAGGIGPYVVPIWNSHQGEVQAAKYIWDHIQESRVKLNDIWPKSIDFWFVRRVGSSGTYKKIGSVVVAKTQCSAFLAKQGVELIERALTTVAHEEYRQGALWDGVLVAPGQGDEAGYEIAEKKTANPNNFTSFVNFVPAGKFVLPTNVRSRITGVAMPAFGAALGDTAQSFFEELINPVTDLKDVPKLIFVLKRTAQVGLLFEGPELRAGDLLDAEEEESGNIAVYEEVGAMEASYADELENLFIHEFPDLKGADFILHRGVNTCLFACPPLGLYTHGYETETVDPVVRFYINKIFERWYNGAKCTSVQAQFFERHQKSWEDNGSGFIQFKIIQPH